MQVADFICQRKPAFCRPRPDFIGLPLFEMDARFQGRNGAQVRVSTFTC